MGYIMDGRWDIMNKVKRIHLLTALVAVCFLLLSGCKFTNHETIYASIEALRNDLQEQEAQQEENREEREPVNIFYNIVQEFYPAADEEEEPAQITAPVQTETIIHNSTTVENTTVVYVQNGNPEEKPGADKECETVLNNFAANEMFFVAGYEETDIVFTVDAPDAVEAVKLYSNANEVVAIMNDDGIAGDIYAGDGIYTAVQSGTHPAGTVDYWAQCGEIASNRITLFFFERPTEESARAAEETVKNIQFALSEIEKAYLDEDGYVAENQKAAVMNGITAYLEQERAAGRVLLYQADADSVDVKLSSGLCVAYAVSEEGTDSIGSDVSMTVLTCQPQFTDMGGPSFPTFGAYTLPSGVNYVLEMLDVAASDADRTFSNYAFSEFGNFDDEEVTLARIRAFGPNQVILWHGHGYYGTMVKSCLCTGEPFDWNAYLWDIEYFMDCVANRIVNGLTLVSDMTIISSGYISKYCGNLDNCFVYLASCNSGSHSGLAQAFLDKGAEAVVANSDTIMRTYNVAMLYETVENMTKVNTVTDNYYTLAEALEAAKEVYGRSDAEPHYGGIGAVPLIFGGADAENFRLADVEENAARGTLSGKVCQAEERSTPVAGASIRVFEGDTLVRNLQANESGNYMLELPVGEYRIEVSANGYVTFNYYAHVELDRNTYLETFLLVAGMADEIGKASGRVFNALTGIGVADVELNICNGWNNREVETAVTSVYTNDAGEYQVELPLGNYTINTIKEGYIRSTINIVVQKSLTAEQNGAISPILTGDDYRVVLGWGQNPRDLDAHVVGPLSNGNDYHVYYLNKNQKDGDATVCNLDVDDITSYGAETITLKTSEDAPYYYYVHLYSGMGMLGTSEAQVKVYQGDNLCALFNVPTDAGYGRYWNVFAVCDGEIIFCDTITDMPDTHYADAFGHTDMTNDIVTDDKNEAPETNEVTERTPVLDAAENTVDGEHTADGEVSVTEDAEETLSVEEAAAPEENVVGEERDGAAGPDNESADLVSSEMDEKLQKAYEVVLDEWREAIPAVSTDWEFSDLSDYDEFTEQYPNVNLSMLIENKISPFGFAFAYFDIDKNGYAELLIGACEAVGVSEEVNEAASEEIHARIISIYGFDGEAAVELNPDLRGAYRISITVYEGGDIWLHDQSGVNVDIFEQYGITEDGFSAEEKVVLKDAEDEYFALIKDSVACVLIWEELV